MNWNEVRDLFPAAKKYTYLKTAGAGPIHRKAFEAAQKFYQELYTDGDFFWDQNQEKMEQVRTKLSQFLNCKTKEIAFVPNTSTGLNLVAQILKEKRFGHVITMADEFPSSVFCWQQQGYPLTLIPSNDDGVIPLSRIDDAVTRESTILCVSHVQYQTGFRHHLAELGKLCYDRNLTLVVDACQSAGAVEIDLEQTPVDFLTFSEHKWMFSGYECGVLYMNQRHIRPHRFPVAGWQSVKDPDSHNLVLDHRNAASALELGCMPYAGMMCMDASLDLLQEIGMKNVEKRVQELTEYVHQKARQYEISIASSPNRGEYAGITILEVQNAPEVVEKLLEKNIFVAARGKGIRVSPHIYNSLDDIDVLFIELGKIVSR